MNPLAQRTCFSQAGKPLWVTVDDADTHPIFFDDNIHNDALDSIVAVRARRTAAEPSYAALDGASTIAMQGLVLRRVPTLDPILDEGWFLAQIDACERRMAAARAAVAAGGAVWCPTA